MKTSEKTEKILEKLLAVKAKLGVVVKDKSNPFHKSKYADINSFLDHVEPVLCAHGLVLLQPTGRDEFGPFVETKIVDATSGQFISSRVDLILAKQDMQGLGSAITYARRYSLQSLLALQAEDDDGNAASHVRREPVNHAPKPQVRAVEPEVVSIGQELVGFGKNREKRFCDVPMKNLMALEGFIYDKKLNDPKSENFDVKAKRFLEMFEAFRHEQELDGGFQGAMG